MDTPVKVRIAPSPTGDPHVGTAYVAVLNLALARKNGGKFILRIEDTDRTRSTPESEKMIYESLRWLNLLWDEGPDTGGPCGPYRQSERWEIYAEHCKKLVETGAAYYCFCTAERLDKVRAVQQAAKQNPKYDGFCKSLKPEEVKAKIAAGEKYVIRLSIPPTGETSFDDLIRGHIAIQNSQLDDQVLLKSDGFPTYHLANVVDDHLMGVTHVMRAEEWISSTPKHVLLYKAFGWEPAKFAHLPLLRNADKSKISKRKNPTSLNWYRDQGYLPEALVNFLSLMGFSMPDGTDVYGFQKLVDNFSFDRVTTTGPVFDMKKLDWINGEYIRMMTDDELGKRLRAFGVTDVPEEAMKKMLPLVKPRLKKLSEFKDMTDFFFAEELQYESQALIPKNRDTKQTVEVLQKMLAFVESTPELQAKPLELAGTELATGLGWKMGDVFMILRIAITGKAVTPPLCESAEIIGKEKVAARLRRAIEKLTAIA
jgi:glutamyl-tRNA synthetase